MRNPLICEVFCSSLSAEWTYLVTTRLVAGNDSAFSYVTLKYGDNATDTVSGVILYPDDFSFAEAGVGMLPFGPFTVTQIDASTWDALENIGCVFIPGCGRRTTADGIPSIEEANFGQYVYTWSSTAMDETKAYYLWNYISGKRILVDSHNRMLGFAVRLVQDL